MWRSYCKRHCLDKRAELELLRTLKRGALQLMVMPDGTYYVQ